MTLGEAAYLAFARHALLERGVTMVAWGRLAPDARAGWEAAAWGAIDEAERNRARAVAARA